MRHYTYRTKAFDMTHSELVLAAKTAAGAGEWSVESVEWYGDDDDERATIELVAPDLPTEITVTCVLDESN